MVIRQIALGAYPCAMGLQCELGAITLMVVEPAWKALLVAIVRGVRRPDVRESSMSGCSRKTPELAKKLQMPRPPHHRHQRQDPRVGRPGWGLDNSRCSAQPMRRVLQPAGLAVVEEAWRPQRLPGNLRDAQVMCLYDMEALVTEYVPSLSPSLSPSQRRVRSLRLLLLSSSMKRSARL